MTDNRASVPVIFMETHTYTMAGETPNTWTPIADPSRSVKNRYVYVFQSTDDGATFNLLKACVAGPKGEITNVKAKEALNGNLPELTAPRSQELAPQEKLSTLLPERLNNRAIKYFFYISRIILDGSFITKLATDRPGELKVVTVSSPETLLLSATDPLTVLEQLAIEYDRARRTHAALVAPFSEQTEAEREATTELLTKRTIASVLAALPAGMRSDIANDLKTKPEDFLKNQNDERAEKEGLRDAAAANVVRWLDGDLMKLVRVFYGADQSPSAWSKFIEDLIRVEAAACARIAESYRGLCLLRQMTEQGHYLINEFANREEDTSSTPDLKKVQEVGKKAWDVLTKFWLAYGAVVGALEAREGPRATQPNTAIPLVRMARSYNTVFGKTKEVVTIERASQKFKFKDPITQRLHDISLTTEILQIDKTILIELENSQSHPTGRFKFKVDDFARGIAVINLGLAMSAAYEKLLLDNSASAKEKTFSAIQLMGGIVDTASSFPQHVARLLRITGRTIAFVGLAGAVLGLATGFMDLNDKLSKGDHDAALGAAITFAGGYAGAVGSLLVFANGGVVVAAASGAFAIALVLVVIGAAIIVLATDTDMESFAKHCFLGKRFGKDTDKPKWSPAKFSAWNDERPGPGQPSGMDHQLHALFNLAFAFTIDDDRAGTRRVQHPRLTIEFGAHPPGANFKVRMVLRSGEDETFRIDPTASNPNISALEPNSVEVTQGKIVIHGVPRGKAGEEISLVRWEVVMETGSNKTRGTSPGASESYIAQPQQVPASNVPVVVASTDSAKSIDF